MSWALAATWKRAFAIPAPHPFHEGFALQSPKPEFWAHRCDKLFDPSAVGGEFCALTRPPVSAAVNTRMAVEEFHDWTFYPGPNAHHQAPQSRSWVDRSSLRPFDEQAVLFPLKVEGHFNHAAGLVLVPARRTEDPPGVDLAALQEKHLKLW